MRAGLCDRAEGEEVGMSIHPNAVNLLGQKIGRLTVIEASLERYHGALKWVCKCSCGNQVVRSAKYFQRRSGRLEASCGCARFTTAELSREFPACGKRFIAKWRERDQRVQVACSLGCSFKIRDTKGAKNANWRNNSTLRNLGGRFTARYRQWRAAVLERDGYACICCGDTEKLHADHIKSWRTHKRLRYSVDNGQTLCASCHRHTPSWGASSMRRAAKRDRTERPIIDGLAAHGIRTWQLDFPCDLLCHMPDGTWRVLEVKTPCGKRNPKPKQRSDQPEQSKFLRETNTPVVTSLEDALTALGVSSPATSQLCTSKPISDRTASAAGR